MRELRVPILVNSYERAVDVHLARFCAKRGLRVHCKPRVADVLPVNDGSLDGADLSYALKAHFDFVIADQDGLAELAVEFDGPTHVSDPKQVARDERKARICLTYALPLVRFGAAAFRQADRRTLLEWLLEVWGAHRDLEAAWAEVSEVEERGEDWVYDLPETKLDDFDYATFGRASRSRGRAAGRGRLPRRGRAEAGAGGAPR